VSEPTKLRVLQSIVLVLIFLQCSCAQDPRVVERRHFAARVKSLLGISFPCTVQCPDNGGGVVDGIFIGTSRDTMFWSWDPGTRLRTPQRLPGEDDRRYEARVDSFQKYHLPYLVHVGGEALPLNSPAESVFIQVLRFTAGVDTVRHEMGPNQDSLALNRMHMDLGRPDNHYLERYELLNSRPRAAALARMLQRQQRGLTAFYTAAEVESLGRLKVSH
jgi:hypothetical protein